MTPRLQKEAQERGEGRQTFLARVLETGEKTYTLSRLVEGILSLFDEHLPLCLTQN